MNSFKKIPAEWEEGEIKEYTIITLKESVPQHLADIISFNIYGEPWSSRFGLPFKPIQLYGHVHFTYKQKKLMQMFHMDWKYGEIID